jgi:hypothetical protein
MKNRETEKQRNRETEKQRNRETEIQRNRDTEKLTDERDRQKFKDKICLKKNKRKKKFPFS